MAEIKEPKTWQIGEYCYVTTQDAARYLHTSHDTLLSEVYLGWLVAVKIESRQMIELETLKAYAVTRKQARRGAWVVQNVPENQEASS